jgi:tetratricopeptide (TPR) repeat protein
MKPWILDRARDLGLMIAAPIWIAPLVMAIAALTGDRAVNTVVMAIGSTGHHLPGMIRAYGDRALFKRFRARFVAAPLVLGALCIGFSAGGLHGIMFIAFVWGIWHALMQTYGFARIYGAKSGAGDRTAARLDLALLAAWFGAAVVWSPLRLGYLIDMGATCGVPFPPAWLVRAVKLAAAGAAAAATVAWLLGAARRWTAARPGLARVALMAGSIGFWWFANVRVRHPLLGAPLFEVFHDVQYLAIVWAFNRRRGEAAPKELRTLARGLFGPGAAALGGYVAAVIGYGALALVEPTGAFGDFWNGLFAASQLLHFYYDGFIWKVREPEIAAPLGVAVAASAPPPTAKKSRRAPTPAPAPAIARGHLVLWAALAAAAIVLGAAEAQGGRSLRQRIPTLVELVPDNGLYHFYAAEMHWERGEHAAALAGFRRSLALDPGYAPSRDNLALSLTTLADAAAGAGDRASARAFLDELARLRPTLTGEVADHADRELARYATWR